MGAGWARREVSDIRASGLASKSRVSRAPAARVFESSELEILEAIHTRRYIPRGNGWQNSSRIVAPLRITEWNEALDEKSERAHEQGWVERRPRRDLGEEVSTGACG